MRTYILNTRLVAILFLGFSSGLPIALIGSTLQAWFTEANMSLAAIGALSLIGIPYTLKFLWAPLMDYIQVARLGMHKGWILITQAALIITLLLLALMNPLDNARLMYFLALITAFLSASQDVAIDAYRTDVLKPDERGLGAAYYVFSYRIAMLVSGGLALVLADFLGWRTMYVLMCVCILVSMLLTFTAPTCKAENTSAESLFAVVMASIKDFISRDKVLLVLLFLALYKFGDALALQLMTNFLLKGLGFTLTEVGLAYKTVSFVASVSGAFVGGLLLTRWHIFKGLFVFGLAQAFSNLVFVMLAYIGKDFWLMTFSIFIENFCSGLSTAALMAFMMSLCNLRYTASQFALLSAVASLGRVFLGPLAALMVASMGWVQFYAWTVVLSMPGLILLMMLKDEVTAYASVAAD